jgi:hypothetical protein
MDREGVRGRVFMKTVQQSRCQREHLRHGCVFSRVAAEFESLESELLDAKSGNPDVPLNLC